MFYCSIIDGERELIATVAVGADGFEAVPDGVRARRSGNLDVVPCPDVRRSLAGLLGTFAEELRVDGEREFIDAVAV